MRARTVVSACALIKRANFVCRFRRAVGPGTYWLAERRLNRDRFVGEAIAVLPITTNDAPQIDDVLDGVTLRRALLRQDRQLGEGPVHSSTAPREYADGHTLRMPKSGHDMAESHNLRKGTPRAGR